VTETNTSHPRVHKPISVGFLVIILFKWLKAATFVLFGVIALRLARASEMPSAIRIADFFSVSRESELVHHVADLIRPITPQQATGFGLASLLVGAVFLVEGVLLAMRVWWSTYLTIVLTALGIPLELYEIAYRPHAPRRYALLAINLVILSYLWARRSEFREKKTAGN